MVSASLWKASSVTLRTLSRLERAAQTLAQCLYEQQELLHRPRYFQTLLRADKRGTAGVEGQGGQQYVDSSLEDPCRYREELNIHDRLYFLASWMKTPYSPSWESANRLTTEPLVTEQYCIHDTKLLIIIIYVHCFPAFGG